MQVIINGLLTHYQSSGKGKVVVLLHGWGDSAQGLRGLQAALAKTYTVVALDLPGFGGTQASEDVWDLNNYAAFVAAFLDKLELKPYAFIAHSNGGAIAIRGLANSSLTAHKLVLLASAGIRGEYEGRNKALRLLTKTGKVLSMPLPAGTKDKLRRKVYKTVGSDMLVAEHLQETFKKIVTDDVRGDAAKLSLPTLLIYGDADEATPVRYGQILHRAITGSQLEVLSGTTHFVHIDQPAIVEKLIEEFLQ